MTDKKSRADLGAFVIHQEGDVFGYFVPGIGGGGAASLEEAIELAEDLVDMQAIAEFKAAEEQGGGEAIPHDFMKVLINADSPLIAWREYRGFSQNQLAKISGVNRIQIGDIEDRGKTGSVVTLKKLAAALDIQVDDLL